MRLIVKLPLFVTLMAVASLAMLVPAIHATFLDLHRTAQPFFYSALLFGVLTALIALATSNAKITNPGRSQLVTLAAGFLALPAMLAVPMWEAAQGLSYFEAYFEMVSAFTTTGASVIDPPSRVVSPIHLWRALVGWIGGFFMLLAAAAILAPMTLGGFEVLKPINTSSTAEGLIRRGDPNQRVYKVMAQLLPVYLGVTVVLWVLLVMAQATPFLALNLAMSTIATSGITPSGGLNPWQVRIYAEIVIFIFL
ncbi:MAG: potassium transporter TrkG, partial [Pseudomonadota bacterium]